MAIRTYWILGITVLPGITMFFTDIEGSFALTLDALASVQFQTKEDAEVYVLSLKDGSANKAQFHLMSQLTPIPQGYT